MMTTRNRTKNSIYNFVSGMAGQLLVITMKFVVRTVFIQVLGKQYLGINGLFSDIITMLSLTELGMDTAINYRLYKPLAEQNEKQIRLLMKFYKKVYLVIGVVIMTLGMLLIPGLKYIIKDYSTLTELGINATIVFLLYLLQSVTSYLFFAYRSAIIKADQKTYIIDIVHMVITIITKTTQIIVLLLLKNFVIYTAVVVVFNIVNNLINAIIAVKLYPKAFIKEKESLSRTETIEMFKDCGALFIYKVNNVVLKATDNIVLSSFIGLAMVGMYSNYLLFYATIRTFLLKLYSATKASMGNLYASEDISKSYFFFEFMNYASVILFGTACIGVSVCANELIEVWIGADYVIKQPFPVLIGIELFFVGLKYNLSQIRNISGAFRQMWYRPLLGIIVNLVVSIVLVNICGIYGVIIGTITADFTTYFMVDPRIIHQYSFKNFKPVFYYYKKNLQYFAVLFMVGIFDLFICSIVAVEMGWISVILHATICAVSVPLVFVVLYWKTDECKYLFAKIKQILRKKI